MSFADFFSPASQVITDISNANPAVVTTATDNGYNDTLQVRIVYPPGTNFGMSSLNGQVFGVTAVTPNSFSIGIDTTMFDPFFASNDHQVAQCIPVGTIGSAISAPEVNNGNIEPEANPLINP